jgi:hypothetical protein
MLISKLLQNFVSFPIKDKQKVVRNLRILVTQCYSVKQGKCLQMQVKLF